MNQIEIKSDKIRMPKRIPSELPVMVTSDMVVFPGIITPLAVKDDIDIKIFNDVLSGDVRMLAMSLKIRENKPDKSKPEPHEIGCAVLVLKMLRIPDGSLRLLIQGVNRIKLERTYLHEDGYLVAKVRKIKSKINKGLRLDALLRTVQEEFSDAIDEAPYLPYEMKIALLNIEDPGALADFVAANLNIRSEERQEILSIINVETRLSKIQSFVNRELQLLKLGSKIQSEVTGTIEKNQREYFLREQLKAIKKELGEDDDGAEIRELKDRIKKLDAPEYVIKAADKEADKLSRISPSSAEYSVSHTYLEWLLDIPWNVSSDDLIEIAIARKILDKDHYGLDDVKERILEYLAVRKLRGEGRGSIICFVGPPGVGKTSIGKSIARAMGRKFVRMSLGGLRDEAEVRGHRRTYIGALPGRIIQNIKRAGTNNPVFMLDEIDKLGSDFRGDPSSAMLEVLDPEQNNSFQDNYLELDFDLSKVMFITTANYLETIPPPLRDRMEIIKLPGYITPEKVQIARKYLVPRQIKENGLKARQLSFTTRGLEQIAVYYTREAGVRTLERTIGKVCRKVAIEITEGSTEKVSINLKNYKKYLGAHKVSSLGADKTPRVGIANGLAWTQAGGVMLFIEAISMPGKGQIKITGQLGDVMKESADIAMSFMRENAERFGIAEDYFKINDFHIHIPEGATPKDGPSAGVTLASAMASLFTGRAVRHDIAMTGEITLHGKVLPIGGLREKSVAAARGDMKMVICPEDNRSDLEEIPDIVKDKLEFMFVDSLDDVLETVLLPAKDNVLNTKKQVA